MNENQKLIASLRKYTQQLPEPAKGCFDIKNVDIYYDPESDEWYGTFLQGHTREIHYLYQQDYEWQQYESARTLPALVKKMRKHLREKVAWIQSQD